MVKSSLSSKKIYAGAASLAKDPVRKIYSGETTNWWDIGGPDEEIPIAWSGKPYRAYVGS